MAKTSCWPSILVGLASTNSIFAPSRVRADQTVPTRYFTPGLFAFLNDLKNNNDRSWFKANQERYEAQVRQPALDFITDYGPKLAKISPHFVADSRTVGGSLFRIQRDTRFSKDKTPYKINTGLQFRHEMASDAHAPGFYLHLEPGNCFMGCGLWRPESKVAYRIRARIDEHSADWKKASRAKRFSDVFTLEGDSLKRPPKGYDPEHALIDDLKRKDFIASAKLTQAEITSRHFMADFDQRLRRTVPLMRFLCSSLDIEF
ncbi:MAG: DUF2461 domain-containing protein [Actinomycetia bacterium]|nr:DUF2461 domain-containing protein [Actinomycetes bacterium]